MNDIKEIHNLVRQISRQMFVKGLIVGLIPLITLVLFASTLPYLKDVADALFIDKDGKVGIGTDKPTEKLDVNGTVKANNFEGDGSSLIVNSDGSLKEALDKKLDKAGGNITGLLTIHDKLDVGTIAPTAKGDNLQVQGNLNVIGATNGEDPPMMFQVGDPSEQGKWLAVEKDIGALCGDEDGGRIRLLMQDETTDEVRTITEELYIEQPDISNNRVNGLHGWARQSGGGDSRFILGTQTKNDIIPNPWKWFWVMNYKHQNAYGQQGPAFTGNDKYLVSFMSHPNVTTTVIIYDR